MRWWKCMSEWCANVKGCIHMFALNRNKIEIEIDIKVPT